MTIENVLPLDDPDSADLYRQTAIEVTIQHAPDLATTASLVFVDADGDRWVVIGGAKLNPSDIDAPWVGQQLALTRALKSLHDELYEGIRHWVEG
jgi:hypothetical protein